MTYSMPYMRELKPDQPAYDKPTTISERNLISRKRYVISGSAHRPKRNRRKNP